jgi:hypothetical protein
MEFWTGIVAGQYDLTGGVIRHAAGSELGGQIVAHLLPAGSALGNLVPGLNFIPGLLANFQISNLSGKIDSLSQMASTNLHALNQLSASVQTVSESTQHILTLATGTALLSGLSLGVSCVGFVAMNKKLKSIDGRLQKIEKDIKEIKDFLELSERAELRSSLSDLLKIPEMKNEGHRNNILNDRRQTLMKINEKYKERLSNSDKVETAVANEEYFCLTGLSYVRCTAEMGMFEIARKEMEELYEFWHVEARRIANDLLIVNCPERFLLRNYAEDIPISAIASWMDFSQDEKKGFLWIDELRQKPDDPWYRKFCKQAFLPTLEKSLIIPTLHKLINRDKIFQGYVAQHELMETYQTEPSQIERRLIEMGEENAIDGHFIFQPPAPQKSAPETKGPKKGWF